MMDLDEHSNEIQGRIKDRRWIEEVIDNGACCWICGFYDDPRIIEWHHIAGRKNSTDLIAVCPNCHQSLSMDQRAWPKVWTLEDNPSRTRQALMLRGHQKILMLMAREERKISNDILNDKEVQNHDDTLKNEVKP